MSFLAPLFLLGAIAVSLPVIFHLIRRSSRQRVPFSSLMFLMPTPPRVTRRSKLENVLLLLLRCLILCLLAFAFARPFLSKPMNPDPAGQGGERVLVLLDTSASMKRGSLWRDAKAKASAVFKNAHGADQVACVTFDREVRPVVSFEEWTRLPLSDRAALASQRLEEISPGWRSTRLGNALTLACEMFETGSKNEQTPKRIVLITDLQEGSRLDGLQGFEWPRGTTVSVEALPIARHSNAGLQLVLDKDALGQPAGEAPIRVRVSNSSDSKIEQFQLGWQRPGTTAYIQGTVDMYVPPGQNRMISIPRPTNEPSADRIVLAGDEEPFDNFVYLVPSKAEQTAIVYLGNDAPTDSSQPLYYLRRAFQETRSLNAQVVAHSPGAALNADELKAAGLIIINDPLPDEQIQQIHAALEQGRTLLVPLSKIATTPTLGKLLGQPGFGADEVSSPSYSMLGQVDFQHPLFASFADPRYSDFTKIHFWKHRRIPLEKVSTARILARFDNGDPALAEVPIGQGRVWILTSGWQPEDSQLALSSKFVPLLYAMLEQSGGVRNEQGQYTVGDAISLPESTNPVTVRPPGASEITVDHGKKFTASEQPGVYQAIIGPQSLLFAVNLSPEESRTAPLPIEDLARIGVPLEKQVTSSPKQLRERREHLHAVQLENQQKLWRWLIVAALVVLMMETWLAGRATRRSVPLSETHA